MAVLLMLGLIVITGVLTYYEKIGLSSFFQTLKRLNESLSGHDWELARNPINAPKNLSMSEPSHHHEHRATGPPPDLLASYTDRYENMD